MHQISWHDLCSHTHTHTHTHTHFDGGSARVVCCRLEHATLAVYSGVLCPASLETLAREVGVYTGCQPTLESITGAMLVTIAHGDRSLEFMRGSSAGAVLVRPDQYTASVAFAQFLAGMGIVRTVWLAQHADRAREWLDRH